MATDDYLLEKIEEIENWGKQGCKINRISKNDTQKVIDQIFSGCAFFSPVKEEKKRKKRKSKKKVELVSKTPRLRGEIILSEPDRPKKKRRQYVVNEEEREKKKGQGRRKRGEIILSDEVKNKKQKIKRKPKKRKKVLNGKGIGKPIGFLRTAKARIFYRDRLIKRLRYYPEFLCVLEYLVYDLTMSSEHTEIIVDMFLRKPEVVFELNKYLFWYKWQTGSEPYYDLVYKFIKDFNEKSRKYNQFFDLTRASKRLIEQNRKRLDPICGNYLKKYGYL